jgi:predicted nucleotidyltransferase
MRIENALDPVLGSPTKLRVLRALTAAPRVGRTGRELSRAAGVSTAQTARDLLELLDVGLVNREVHGRSFTWVWNPSHVLSECVAEVLDFERRLRVELIEEIGRGLAGLPIRQARIFGSFATRSERSDSDVDLFVEARRRSDVPRVQDAVARIQERVWSRFGNPLTALVYSSAEVGHPPNPELIRQIRSEGVSVPVHKGAGSVADPVVA